MTPEDFVTQARKRYQHEGARGIDWTFFQSMEQADRAAFDSMLVRIADPLAFEPGTTEQRFKAYVMRLARP